MRIYRIGIRIMKILDVRRWLIGMFCFVRYSVNPANRIFMFRKKSVGVKD